MIALQFNDSESEEEEEEASEPSESEEEPPPGPKRGAAKASASAASKLGLGRLTNSFGCVQVKIHQCYSGSSYPNPRHRRQRKTTVAA